MCLYKIHKIYNNSTVFYMEIFGLLTGSILKITDEILDTNYKPLLPYLEYSKTLCTIMSTIFLYNDIFSSIIHIFAIIPICWYMNEIDNTYYKTLIPLPFITVLLQYNKIQYNGLEDTIFKIVLCMFIVYTIYLEAISFPEETSSRKTISRFIMACILIGTMYVIHNFYPSLDYLLPLFYLGLGYTITGILFKTVLYNESHIELHKKSE